MTSVLTAANQLTLLRLLLIPVFVLFLVYGFLGWALVTFVVAGITDLLDGLIARLMSQPTTLGAWLDPLADKLLLVTTFVSLTLPGFAFANHVPVWLTVLVVSRDMAIVLTVAVFNLAIARRTFRPSLLGKLATGTYIVTCAVALYANYLQRPSATFVVLVYASFAITLVSGFNYVWRVTRGTGADAARGDAGALR